MVGRRPSDVTITRFGFFVSPGDSAFQSDTFVVILTVCLEMTVEGNEVMRFIFCCHTKGSNHDVALPATLRLFRHSFKDFRN